MIDGIAKVKPLVKACAENNMVAMALTDFTNFCGVVRFYGEALSSGIKPIIGTDVLVKSAMFGDEPFELTLLAKNNAGYKNITLLLSKAYQRGYVDLPYIDQDWLIEHREGVIILSGGTKGDVGKKCEEDEGALPHNRGLAAEEVFEQEAVGMFDFAIVEHDCAVCEDGTQRYKPAHGFEKPA